MIRSRIFFDYTGSTWPITTSEAKNYLRVTYSDDDTLIGDLISNVGDICQRVANSQVVDTVDVKVIAIQPSTEFIQGNKIELPYPNSSISISSVTVDGSAITSDDYTLGSDNVLTLDSQPARDVVVVVEYTATLSDLVDLTTPMLKLIADAYENRTEQSIESLSIVKMNAKKYLQSFVSGADMF